MKRKKELIVILSSLLVIVLSVSVAYFTTKILGTGKEISVESADLKVIFTSGSGTINGSNIEPGWSSGENTFTVKNESNGTYSYNIIIKDLVNTFVTEGFLQYKITSTDGGYNMTDFEDVPKSSTKADTTLAENISIEKGATHTYKIVINYINSDDVNQSADMGKKLSGKIFIEKYKTPTLASKLLRDNPTISTRSDFSTPFTTNTANTLYKITEDGTDVYYFAGQDTESTPVHNWVKIGTYVTDGPIWGYYSETEQGYKEYTSMEECTSATKYNINCSYAWKAGDSIYWRIIRTNSDGSIRVLYSGTNPGTTNGYIGQSEFNASSNSPKYVGYMYGDSDTTLEEARTNTNDSTIKTYIDNWYENNLTTYTNYLSNDAIYCNDRELRSGKSYSVSSMFQFKAYERLGLKKVPSYDCTNSKDAFSVNNTEAKLKYPIALMTADEIAYAGGVIYENAPMWYYTNSTYSAITGEESWWTLSSGYGGGSTQTMWYVFSSADRSGINFDGGRSLVENGATNVRPVTSLKSCVLWKSGDGSADNPYEIVENGGC